MLETSLEGFFTVLGTFEDFCGGRDGFWRFSLCWILLWRDFHVAGDFHGAENFWDFHGAGELFWRLLWRDFYGAGDFFLDFHGAGDFFGGIFTVLEISSGIFTVLETSLEEFSWCWRLLLEILRSVRVATP